MPYALPVVAMIILCLSALTPQVAMSGPIQVERQVLVFQGVVGDGSMPNQGGGLIPAIQDSNGYLQNVVAVGDAVTIRITLPPIDDIEFITSEGVHGRHGYASLIGSGFTVQVGPYRWVNSLNTDGLHATPWLSIQDGPGGLTLDQFVADAGNGRLSGGPSVLGEATYWSGTVNLVRYPSDPSLTIPTDYFELPDPLDFQGAALTVAGFTLDGPEAFRFRANLTSSSVVPIPEPAAAMIFMLNLGLVAASSRRKR